MNELVKNVKEKIKRKKSTQEYCNIIGYANNMSGAQRNSLGTASETLYSYKHVFANVSHISSTSKANLTWIYPLRKCSKIRI